MKIICDTNIWYEFAKNPPDEKLYVENDLISTFISIDELSKTYWLFRFNGATLFGQTVPL